MPIPKKAQTVVEYTMIIVLVTAAIMVAGPFLINSVKSYFRMTDDTVQEAWRDKK